MFPAKINFVCLKYGTKYSSQYVNTLYSMLTRHVSIPFDLHCMTEDPTDIIPDVKIVELPDLGLDKWWWKMLMFKEDFFEDGMFLDLDIIIKDDITHLYAPSKFMRILYTNWIDLAEQKRWTIGDNYKYCELNSSVMCWDKNTKRQFIWDDFVENRDKILFLYKGIDNYLENRQKRNIEVYPNDQSFCYSYWNCEKEYRPESSIILFDYNNKKQHQIRKKWVKELWV